MARRSMGLRFAIHFRARYSGIQRLTTSHAPAVWPAVPLSWWVESKNTLPPKELNDLFRALILPTFAATWSEAR
jgi:hypothetical protein